jgi:predicted ATPase with chaperone activity
LFSDEIPEFGTRVLKVMRQPMEDKVVTISRAKGSLTFSANFPLIAVMTQLNLSARLPSHPQAGAYDCRPGGE